LRKEVTFTHFMVPTFNSNQSRGYRCEQHAFGYESFGAFDDTPASHGPVSQLASQRRNLLTHIMPTLVPTITDYLFLHNRQSDITISVHTYKDAVRRHSHRSAFRIEYEQVDNLEDYVRNRLNAISGCCGIGEDDHILFLALHMNEWL